MNNRGAVRLLLRSSHQQRRWLSSNTVPVLQFRSNTQPLGLSSVFSTCHFSSTPAKEEDQEKNSFTSSFSFPQQLSIARTSGRRKKRLQRLKQQQQHRRERMKEEEEEGPTVGQKLHDKFEGEEDHRTWRTILFPNVHDDPEDKKEPPLKWPKTPGAWAKVLKEAWGIYRWTWEGFLSKPKKDTDGDDVEEKDSAGELIADNVKRNVKFSREEGGKLFKQAQERTGIYTIEDLKQLAREMMTVATKMLTEFMAEYRKGRDEEVEKMLHEYFQEEEEDTKEGSDKDQEDTQTRRKKRRRKRRIPMLNA